MAWVFRFGVFAANEAIDARVRSRGSLARGGGAGKETAILGLLDIGAIPPPAAERLEQSHHIGILSCSCCDDAQSSRQIQLFGGQHIDAGRGVLFSIALVP